VSVKDIYGVPGVPVYAGSKQALPEKWQSPGPLVRCLLDSKAAIVGKTNTVQFAFGALGLNNVAPTPKNPWDAVNHRTPGRIEPGCGRLAVAGFRGHRARHRHLRFGAHSGLAHRHRGLQADHRTLVHRRHRPAEPYLDTPGILSRTVEDAAFAAAAMERAFGRTSGAIAADAIAGKLRIGIPESLFWTIAIPASRKAGERLSPSSSVPAIG
jgi:aspartyl-tRNA(Asn)/glutamyl-tRNA(Gln) amidotransferase subunit A